MVKNLTEIAMCDEKKKGRRRMLGRISLEEKTNTFLRVWLNFIIQLHWVWELIWVLVLTDKDMYPHWWGPGQLMLVVPLET